MKNWIKHQKDWVVKEGIYTYGFLNIFWTLIAFFILVIFKGDFVFSWASLPTLSILIILEMVQAYSSLHAIVESDRSTFGFLMIGTIPLLLIVDIILGYDLRIFYIWGTSLIVISLLVLLINHGINKKGIGFVIFSTVNAVVTISLYKYNITHFNSVSAQQIITLVPLLIFLFIMAKWKLRENPLRYVFRKDLLIQSLSRGVGGLLVSVAYLYAPASVITSGRRGVAVLFSIISGNKIFHEKHLVIKLISFVGVVAGLILFLF